MGLACPCGTFVPGALATLSRYAPLVGIQGTQDVMSRHREIEKDECFYIYMRLDLIKKIARLRAELVLLAFSYRRDALF